MGFIIGIMPMPIIMGFIIGIMPIIMGFIIIGFIMPMLPIIMGFIIGMVFIGICMAGVMVGVPRGETRQG
jgi:hypothetical protein